MAPLFERDQNQVNVRKSHAKPAFTSVLRPAYTVLAAASHADGVRRAVVFLTILAALAIASSASARPPGVVDRGVVLRVRPHMLFIQELDGTRARIVVVPRTVIVLDGHPATLRDLRRGDVVFVLHVGRRPALRIRAFSR